VTESDDQDAIDPPVPAGRYVAPEGAHSIGDESCGDRNRRAPYGARNVRGAGIGDRSHLRRTLAGKADEERHPSQIHGDNMERRFVTPRRDRPRHVGLPRSDPLTSRHAPRSSD
jgi:hypothetical protein